jgi:hypothetical protein
MALCRYYYLYARWERTLALQGVLYLVGAALVALAIYVDAAAIGMSFGGPTGREGHLGAAGWAIMVAAIPPSFPIYLVRRVRFVRRTRPANSDVAAIPRRNPLWSSLIVVALACWIVAAVSLSSSLQNSHWYIGMTLAAVAAVAIHILSLFEMSVMWGHWVGASGEVFLCHAILVGVVGEAGRGAIGVDAMEWVVQAEVKSAVEPPSLVQ